jgi:hypothetical protein
MDVAAANIVLSLQCATDIGKKLASGITYGSAIGALQVSFCSSIASN